MPNILLVDDHAVVRAGLRYLLENSDQHISVAEAENASQALAMLRDQPFDAIILDISIPGRHGLEFLKQINKEHSIPALVLSIHPEELYGVRALKDGAMGYLTKSSAPDKLLEAVARILAGKHYISPALAEFLAAEVSGGADQQAKHQALSDREHEVFRAIVVGKTPSEIAAEFSLSVKTVHTYRSRILTKLELKSTAELIRYAYLHDLLD